MNWIKTKILNNIAPEYFEMLENNSQLSSYSYLFNRFIDKQIIDNQIRTEFTTDGKVRDICVIFTDVRGFTALSETISLKSANSFLNNFYDIVIEHTQNYGGVMDKFLGDGTMSIFGAYGKKKNYIYNSVLAARAIMKDFRDMTSQKDEPTLSLGIGIHKGPAILGTFGNGDFVSFTAIGHTVNLASRIQGQALNNEILVTKEVTEFLDSDEFISHGIAKLKNVTAQVELFEVV